MAYTNEVHRLIVEGGDSPPLVASLWMVTRTVSDTSGSRSQSVYEEAPAAATSPPTFTLVNGPSLLAQTARQCGLSVHETGVPGATGPLFRFGDVDELPTPAPADPEGYVDVIELAITDVDVTTRTTWGRPFSTLPIQFGAGSVTSITAMVPAVGSLDLVVGGDTGGTPWSCTRSVRLVPSWELDPPTRIFDSETLGESLSGPVPDEARTWTRRVVEIAYLNALHQDVVQASIEAWARLLVPPVKPSLIPGAVVPGIVLSASRLALVPPSTLRLQVVVGGFGSTSDRQFPPTTRETGTTGGRGCLVGGASLVVGVALGALGGPARPRRTAR